MLDRRAEHDGTLVPHILEPCVHDEAVALRHIDLALQIADVILNAIEAHFCQINIGVDTNAAQRCRRQNHRRQTPSWHSIQHSGQVAADCDKRIFKYRFNILIEIISDTGKNAKPSKASAGIDSARIEVIVFEKIAQSQRLSGVFLKCGNMGHDAGFNTERTADIVKDPFP